MNDPRVQELSSRAFRALVVAVVKYSNEDGAFWPGQKRWADASGLSLATLKRAIRELEEKGLLERQRTLRSSGPGEGTCNYRLTVRPESTGVAAPGSSGLSYRGRPASSDRNTGKARTETERATGAAATADCPAFRLDPQIREVLDRLAANAGADSPSDSQLADLSSLDPDVVRGHIVDIAQSGSIGNPIAVLWSRVCDGTIEENWGPGPLDEEGFCEWLPVDLR